MCPSLSPDLLNSTIICEYLSSRNVPIESRIRPMNPFVLISQYRRLVRKIECGR